MTPDTTFSSETGTHAKGPTPPGTEGETSPMTRQASSPLQEDNPLRDDTVKRGGSTSNLKDSQRILGKYRREAEKPDVDQLLAELKQFDARVDLEKSEKRIPDCADGAMVSRCEEGHRNFIPCRCKREWCEDCGDRHGYLNTRRYNQWIDRAKALYKAENVHSNKDKPCLAYWTVTFPARIQEKMKDRDVLSSLQSETSQIFKDVGYQDILCCWHWQGEGDDQELWKPHLNFMVSDNYLDPEKFSEIKREIAGKLARLVNRFLDLDDPVTGEDFNPFCELKKFPAQVGHCVSYVVRPTLRVGIDEDKELTRLSTYQVKRRYKQLYDQVLQQYMNMRVYGSIRGSNQETRTPVCGECEGELNDGWAWCDRQWVEDVIVDASLKDDVVKVGSVDLRSPPDEISEQNSEAVYEDVA